VSLDVRDLNMGLGDVDFTFSLDLDLRLHGVNDSLLDLLNRVVAVALSGFLGVVAAVLPGLFGVVRLLLLLLSSLTGALPGIEFGLEFLQGVIGVPVILLGDLLGVSIRAPTLLFNGQDGEANSQHHRNGQDL